MFFCFLQTYKLGLNSSLNVSLISMKVSAKYQEIYDKTKQSKQPPMFDFKNTLNFAH